MAFPITSVQFFIIYDTVGVRFHLKGAVSCFPERFEKSKFGILAFHCYISFYAKGIPVLHILSVILRLKEFCRGCHVKIFESYNGCHVNTTTTTPAGVLLPDLLYYFIVVITIITMYGKIMVIWIV